MGVDPSGYAFSSVESFRSGMACSVLKNQGEIANGNGGVVYADSPIEYLERVRTPLGVSGFGPLNIPGLPK